MPVVISGIGTAVPAHHITQDLAAEGSVPFCCDSSQQARLLQGLFARSGVQRRHSVLLNGSEGPMADRQDFYPPRSDAMPHGPSTGSRMQCYEEHAAPTGGLCGGAGSH